MVRVTFPMADGTTETLTEAEVARLQKVYKGIDVAEELFKASEWLRANPKRRKSNLARFLTNWLTRQHDRAKLHIRDGAYHEPKGSRPTADPEYMRVYQEHYFRLEKELGNLEAAREARRRADEFRK